MPPAALIFDVDGTIAETEELHRRAFNEVFRGAGLPWDWDFELYRALLKVTGGRERILHFIRTHQPPSPADIEDRVASLHAAKNARYAELMAAGALQLRPGVARLIAESARAGIKIAIATTTSRANVAALLRATPALAGLIPAQYIVVGEDVARKKPDPEVYAIALQRLGVAAETAVAFEDSRNGLLAARAADLKVIVTPGIYTGHETFEGALSQLSDLGEPASPYRHLAGKGRDDRLVDVGALTRWMAAA